MESLYNNVKVGGLDDMITKISLENFKSFDQAVEMTMVSSSKIRTKVDHRVQVGSKTRLLKHAIIYGANASGKSNLVDFFRFFKATLDGGLPLWGTKYFCRTKPENEERDSVFEIQMEIDSKFYAYGFSAVLAQRIITGEWLYELYQNGSSKCIYEREKSVKPVLDISIKLTSEEQNRFATYADDFEDNISDLFLMEMNRGKKYAEGSRLQIFPKIYNWLKNNIVIITPDFGLTDFQYFYEDESLTLINDLIATFDTGISNVRIEEIDISELSEMLPKKIFEQVLKKVRNNIAHSQNHYRMSGRSDKCFFNIEAKGNDEPKITTIKLSHGKSIYDFDFSDESDGTRRLFDLMDMLLLKRKDVVFVVDELERSLHPKLTERFLELFSKMHRERKTQLIFTTHEASIMDQRLFRRDEIWFIERSEQGSSRIYSLDRFKERYDKVLSKAYLDGRYGAIPEFKRFRFGKEV